MLSIGTTRRAQRGMLREWRLHALSVFSLAVAFVCLGAALLVVTNLRAVEDRWAHAGRVSVYLKDSISTPDVEALKSALTATAGVKSVRYISSGQARQDFAQTEKKNLAGLSQEAFPSSIEVEVQPDMADAELTEMVTKLEKLPGVDEIETYQAWTDRLARLVRGGVAASGILALVVFASVLAVVGSTIRLALQRRRTEVEVLKLVGATDRFIKGPFLVEGSAQGAMGAMGALALLATLFFLVKGRLDGELSSLIGVEPSFLPWPIALGMVGVGAVLGALAALLGLRRLVAV
ncbi:MAG: ABC transporter permease [Polyangiaceae bacterium]|nr:ABC transporter permease [Polyangiaceae bacterium]